MPPAVVPLPPVAAGGTAWDELQPDPVAVLAVHRAELGDTFVVDSGGDRHLFVFSPEGVRAFYALAEEDASKGVADWRMLRRKLPDELFTQRRTLPHELFGRDDVATHLDHLDAALATSLAELGDEGEIEVFAFTRRLAHRMGLAAWGGPGSASGARFEALVVVLDALDASEAFVRPDLMAEVARTDKAAEREALAAARDLLAATLDEHDAARRAGTVDPHDLFARIVVRWDGEAEADRADGVTGDVVLLQLASMSNLFAALGWAIVDLVGRPAVLAEVAAGARAVVEGCALESIRMAQRSIMLRHVLRPVTLATGPDTSVAVEPGVTLATLLPLTNTSAAPDLDHWDPGRWRGRRLGDHDGLPAVELVTTFGHGPHTCPAQPFSLAALARTLRALATTYRLEPGFAAARPLATQIGGVARAADPCPVRYHRR